MTDIKYPQTASKTTLATTSTLRQDASEARPSFPAFSGAFAQGAIPPAPSTAFIKREIARCKCIHRVVVYASIAAAFAIYGTIGYACYDSDLAKSLLLAGLDSLVIGTLLNLWLIIAIWVPLAERFSGAHDSVELLADIAPDQAPAILALCRQHPELDAYRQACIGLGRPLILAEAKAFKAYSDAASAREALARAEIDADIQRQRQASELADALSALASPTPCALAPAENANTAARGMISSLRVS
jgi:hypothetical protein